MGWSTDYSHIKMGDDTVITGRLRIGDTMVKSVYLGNSLIWPIEYPTETTDQTNYTTRLLFSYSCTGELASESKNISVRWQTTDGKHLATHSFNSSSLGYSTENVGVIIKYEDYYGSDLVETRWNYDREWGDWSSVWISSVSVNYVETASSSYTFDNYNIDPDRNWLDLGMYHVTIS